MRVYGSLTRWRSAGIIYTYRKDMRFETAPISGRAAVTAATTPGTPMATTASSTTTTCTTATDAGLSRTIN